MTFQNLIDNSGRLLDLIREDRSFGPSESARLLTRLNGLLGSWSQARWAIRQMKRETVALTGAASYTFAPASGLIRIQTAEVISTGGARAVARVVTADQWTDNDLVDDSETGLFADQVFVDYGSPCTLRPWPKPPSGSLILYCLEALTAAGALSDNVSFPDGYQIALEYSFAEVIAPEYQREVPAAVSALAKEYRDAIAGTNAQNFPPPPPAPEVAQ